METRIASLLHDIGKLYQRTNTKLPNVDLYTRYKKNGRTHVHACYTAMFFDKFLNEKLENFSKVLDASSNHHRDNTSIISKADIIAAAHDRKDNDIDLLEDSTYEDKSNYYEKRLISIFNEVSLDDNQKNTEYIASLTPLNVLNYKSSKNNLLYNQEAKKEYDNLFNKFKEELEKNGIKQINDWDKLHDYLYPLIKEYTCTVPANTYQSNFSTVSLFDHLKLSASIASVMEIKNNDKFIILDYDLSGIQNFIFRITEGEDTKSQISKHFRARSFYLSVLSDVIAFYILRQFNLSYENILYSSGGRGSILLPDVDDLDERLKEISRVTEEELFEKFNAELFVSYTYRRVDSLQLKKETISDLRKPNSGVTPVEVSVKYRKFANILSSKNDFTLPKHHDLCKMCGINSAKNSGLCDDCLSMIKLNDKILSKKEFIMKFTEKDEGCLMDINFGKLGNVLFYDSSTLHYTKGDYYISVNNHLIGETKYYAKHDNSNLSFEEIAKKSSGDPKMAVVKMDVDNLGYIFGFGIKDSNTISKNLTLSRMMDYFFSKKLMDIINKDFKDDNIYINYSGGDDLLVITPADVSLKFVKVINEEFYKYTGCNNSIHMSCGIEILKPQSPVRFAVLRAEDNLELSKASVNKASTTVISSTVSNKDLQEIMNEIEYFRGKMSQRKISRTCLYKIYQSVSSSLNNSNIFKKNIPHIAYSIARNVTDVDTFKKLKNMFVRNNITNEDLQKYKIILGYTLMITRNGGKK